jgi:hypothetical protein
MAHQAHRNLHPETGSGYQFNWEIDMHFVDTTVLITGANRGIGQPLLKKPSIGERKEFLRALVARFQMLPHA